ncbi:MAG: bacteriocin class II family protein [Sphaerochaetaceae bacterium]
MIYSNVQLFKALSISGGDLQYEDDLHKPLFTSGDFTKICSDQEAMAAIAGPVVPRNGHEFREMNVNPGKALDLLSPPHFLKADTDVGPIYGWIDRITPLHESDRQWSYWLEWHPDWWLTAQSLGKLEFGPGRFTKCASSARARPALSQPRYWKNEFSYPLLPTDKAEPEANHIVDGWTRWAIIARTETSNGRTSIQYYFWPVDSNFKKSTTTTYNRSLSLYRIFAGETEEALGFDPNSVIGYWLSPVMPWTNYTIRLLGDEGIPTGHSFGTSDSLWHRYAVGSTVKTDDRAKYVFADPTGAIVYTAPWGLEFSEVDMRADIGTNGAYLDFYLNTPDDRRDAGLEGRQFSFPLPTLPLTSNAWSSYVYSGQREYDIAAKKLQRDEAAVSGISGIGTSAIGGAIAGSMVAPGIGTAAGLIGGAFSSLIGTGVSYLTSGKYDTRGQKPTDRLASNQTAALIIGSGGGNSLSTIYGTPGPRYGWTMHKMIRDPVSLAEYDAEVATLGYDTDFLAADCSELISAGGPMRISDLQVRGDMPAEGKQYISTLFARGVNIDIIR